MNDDPRNAVLADIKTMDALSIALTGALTRMGKIEREQIKLHNRLNLLENDIAKLIARYREE